MAAPIPPSRPGQSSEVKPGGSQQSGRPVGQGMLGIGPENFEPVFIRHAHDGTAMGGASLFGPYFIRDDKGNTFRIIVRAGALALEAV